MDALGIDEATFRRVAEAWDNPDWVDVTLHSYRSRWNEAEPDPKSIAVEEKIKATKTLPLPTVYIWGAADGVNPPGASKQVPEKFTGPFAYVELPGVGHFLQREAPYVVANVLLDLFFGRAEAAQALASPVPVIAILVSSCHLWRQLETIAL